MYEILSALTARSRVLDLGSNAGSFDSGGFPGLKVVRADAELPGKPPNQLVLCLASGLPFADKSFDAIILNHSLEHFSHLSQCVKEIARVLAPEGFVYIAVPDASTVTDRVYRWLGRGGGHVNLFSDPAVVPALVTAETGLEHTGTRVLCTSLSFLNRNNICSKPLRLLLFANGSENVVRMITFLLRNVDRWFKRRASVYGWAFYFGNLPVIDTTVWSNVCVRCGSGHPSSTLETLGRVRRRVALPALYTCPNCGTRNYFTEDQYFQYLRV